MDSNSGIIAEAISSPDAVGIEIVCLIFVPNSELFPAITAQDISPFCFAYCQFAGTRIVIRSFGP